MSRLRIGVLGGGQLGRMMALAGYPLDLAFSFYESTPDCPSAGLGPVFGDADNSPASLDAFMESADVFTYEFENIPVAWVERIAARKPLYPGVKSLAVSQNRLNEKQLFARLNIPSARFAEIRSEADLHQAVATLGLPLVMSIPLVIGGLALVLIGFWPGLVNWLTVPAGQAVLAFLGR